MNTGVIMILILIITGLEIFFSIFTNLIMNIAAKLGKDISINEKVYTVVKLIVVALFLASVIYFLVMFIKVLATWFGIPLNKSIFDFFK